MAPPPGAEIVPSPTPAASAAAITSATEFLQFDVVSDEPTDHHFYRTAKLAPASNGVHKKIMQEWRVLESNLPDSIFVRVYETRISLLCAAIVGAPGTPYHDGLFFFDISLPADYPSHPPSVHYRSFGFRINPNLYDTGRVCLSLLNTWSGHKSEKWDRNQSTILQVLLSIQALVLNEKPYFNEPGYGGSRGKKFWEKKAAEYNQDVFIFNCKSAMCLLRNPPRNFEPLVTAHFRDRAIAILTAFNAYRNGLATVGGRIEAAGASGESKIEVSSRFRATMEKLYGDLVEAFAKNGAPIEHFVKQLAGEKEAKAEAKEKEAKKKEEKRKKARSAIRKKIMAIIDKIWVRTGFKRSADQNSMESDPVGPPSERILVDEDTKLRV